MSEPARPQDSTIIAVQKQEIDRLSDNRVMLLSMLEEMQAAANEEITRLGEVLAAAVELLSPEHKTKIMVMLEPEKSNHNA